VILTEGKSNLKSLVSQKVEGYSHELTPLIPPAARDKLSASQITRTHPLVPSRCAGQALSSRIAGLPHFIRQASQRGGRGSDQRSIIRPQIRKSTKLTDLFENSRRFLIF